MFLLTSKTGKWTWAVVIETFATGIKRKFINSPRLGTWGHRSFVCMGMGAAEESFEFDMSARPPIDKLTGQWRKQSARVIEAL